MAQTLGILVTSDKYLDYIINMTDAANKKGKQVQIFFTGNSVKLSLTRDFEKLVGKAKLSICDVSFRAHGFYGREEEVPGVGFKDFATQARNAEMSAQCDKYIVF